MFRITKKTMALVAVCALVFAACSKNESAGGNAASAQSTGSQLTAHASGKSYRKSEHYNFSEKMRITQKIFGGWCRHEKELHDSAKI